MIEYRQKAASPQGAAAADLAALFLSRAAAERIIALEEEVDRLRAVADDLRAALTAEASPAPLEWGLTASEARIFGVLVARPLATIDAIMTALYSCRAGDAPDEKIISIFVYKMRQKIKRFGVEIVCIHGRGFRLEESVRTRFLRAGKACSDAPAAEAGFETPREWGLTLREARIVAIMVARPVATREAVDFVLASYGGQPLSARSLDAAMSYLRLKLRLVGVTVFTQRGVGYRLDAATRARLSALAPSSQPSPVPRQARDEGAQGQIAS